MLKQGETLSYLQGKRTKFAVAKIMKRLIDLQK